ncbi:phosphotransferase family protein [Saccharibacillus qingshengii]|uniref:phosphotransferase family protein n=1 Tax=Saccharibacillus qingshengii TaxID=1763540 RepID=UPI001FE4C032|nr:aminoglycoside phosphotransferase family protein [Saccharibacillus qingshengii]
MDETNDPNRRQQEVCELPGRAIAPLGEIIEAYPVAGGLSTDRKYKVHFYGYDGAYLLRLFDEDSLALKRAEYEALHRMQAMTVHCSRPIAIGRWEPAGPFFLLVSYIEGTDAAQLLPLSPKPQQLRIGMQAGEALSRIGCYEAPEDMEAWGERCRRKVEREMAALQTHGIRTRAAQAAAEKIRRDLHLAEGRPSVFLHGRFGPENLIVQMGRLAGVVGFERFGWGDPLYEFAGLGLHSRQASTLFCTGQILGYHGGQEPEPAFWRLYGLYAAVGAISLLAEAAESGIEHREERLEQAIRLTDELERDHEGFANDRPSWFAAL